MKPSLWPISCFLSCQKLLFLAEVIAISEIAHFLWLLATPYIYKVWCKQRYIDTYIYRYIWVLASTLAHSASGINKTLSVTYKLLFILSKILFLAEVIAISEIAHFLWLLATPYIYKVWCKQRYIHTYIWVLASTLAHSASEINKALSVTYKLLFILSKNIVPSRSYRYIRDRAFPVTACHPLYIQSLM